MTRSNIVKCLTDEVKQEIRNTFESSDVTKTELAKYYEVSVRTVGRVLSEESKLPSVEWDFSVSKDSIVIFKDGESKSVSKGYPKFNTLKGDLVGSGFCDQKLSEVWELMDIPNFIQTFSEGNITVCHEKGVLKYGTFEVKHTIVDCIMDTLTSGKGDVLPMIRFLDKLLQNPDKNIVEQLYPFLNHNSISINVDGDIEAYRSVRKDMTDHRTGKILNEVGTFVTMPRSQVDCDPNKTCSAGLHVSSRNYASIFGGNHSTLLKVVVNPVNICSVPYDYEGQKMRVDKFFVKEVVR